MLSDREILGRARIKRARRLVHYGVSGPITPQTPVPGVILSPEQFGEDHDTLTSSTAEDVGGADGGD